ncbi:GerMN domain-containing protein [Anaerosolibacter sp.]|uniref:GerMN domain-containing protein n=1 Tax=Anaerosolibacter sp. TaxID=1872527 RepID=UPI0039EFDF53
MLRSLLNLCLVGIICVTATTIPIEKNGLDMNISFKFPKIQMPKFQGPKLPTKVSPPELVYAGNSEVLDLENPYSYQFYIRSKKPQELTYDSDNPLVLEIIQDNQIIKTLTTSDFVQILPEDQNSIEDQATYQLDLSQQKLGLPDGKYVFHIYGTAQELKGIEPLALNITYSTISPYLPATNTTGKGKMGVTMFFSDSQNPQQLVPVTRFVPSSNAPLRATIDQTRKGSDILGFEPPIPGVSKIQIRQGTAILHLGSDLERFNQDPALGNAAVKSFVNALTAIPGVDKVKFLVNGRESDNIFGGMSTREPLGADINPKIYLGLNLNQNRVLLAPVSLNDQHMVYENIFHGLRTGEIGGQKITGLMAPIPQKVNLINHTLTGDQLTLNLSKEFTSVYSDRHDLQKMMVDAIVYSYTSIIGVNSVQILVEGQSVHALGDMNLTGNIKKPLYINPEVQQ